MTKNESLIKKGTYKNWRIYKGFYSGKWYAQFIDVPLITLDAKNEKDLKFQIDRLNY